MTPGFKTRLKQSIDFFVSILQTDHHGTDIVTMAMANMKTVPLLTEQG